MKMSFTIAYNKHLRILMEDLSVQRLYMFQNPCIVGEDGEYYFVFLYTH